MVNEPASLKEYNVEWSGTGRRPLLELLRAAGIAPESSCGGRGKCGKCRVWILSGDCTPPGEDEIKLLTAEEIERGIRLACYCNVKGEVILLSEQDERKTRILENSLSQDFQLEPLIRKQEIFIPQDYGQGSLLEYIVEQLNMAINRESLLPSLNFLGEYGQERLRAIIRDDTILGFEPADTRGDCYGLAVDIGTTTVVAGLFDLNDGRELAVSSALNPQKEYGLDVLSRIQHVQNNPSGLKALNALIIRCLNDLLKELCEKTRINHHQIYEITVSANTVMLHLFLGVNPQQLGRFPYRTVFRAGITISAKDLGLEASPFARVYCMPSVSSFVGADIVAGIMATGLEQSNKTALFLDIGTNGEIVLNKNGRLLACSTAAGPALEGMNISCGMRAAEGAVEEVSLQNGVGFRTIGNLPPRGLCGSGLLSLTAELLNAGVILPSGRMTTREEYQETHPGSPLAGFIDNSKGKRRFWLAPPAAYGDTGVFISQADVRQVQLAKGAIITGINSLLAQLELNEEEVEKVYLAGAFGSYVDPKNLLRLGFFPAFWQDRICFAGNSSKAGAVMALLSGTMRMRAEEISQKVCYFELSSYPGFEKLFVKNMLFPKSL